MRSLSSAFEIGRHPLTLESATARQQDGFAVERLRFSTASGATVRGIVTRPDKGDHRWPAILYVHAHGNRHAIGEAASVDSGFSVIRDAL